jgi:hypothetical protein
MTFIKFVLCLGVHYVLVPDKQSKKYFSSLKMAVSNDDRLLFIKRFGGENLKHMEK